MIQHQLIRAKYSLLFFLKKEYSDPIQGCNIIGLLQDIFVFVGFGLGGCVVFFVLVLVLCFFLVHASMHKKEHGWILAASS